MDLQEARMHRRKSFGMLLQSSGKSERQAELGQWECGGGYLQSALLLSVADVNTCGLYSCYFSPFLGQMLSPEIQGPICKEELYVPSLSSFLGARCLDFFHVVSTWVLGILVQRFKAPGKDVKDSLQSYPQSAVCFAK